VEVEGYKPFRQEEELLGYPGVRMFIALMALPAEKPAAPGPVVFGPRIGLAAGSAERAASRHGRAFFRSTTPPRACRIFKKY